MTRSLRYTSVAGAFAVALIALYAVVPRSSNGPSKAPSPVNGTDKENGDVRKELDGLRREVRSLKERNSKPAPDDEQLDPERSATKDTAAEEAAPSPPTREESLLRAANRAAAFRQLMTTREHNTWATDKEAIIRTWNGHDGASLTSADCVDAICRITFTTVGDTSVFDVIETALNEKSRAFAREVERDGDRVQYEAFLSPTGTEWPNL